MKILLKFKDGMTVQSVIDENHPDGPEEFLQNFVELKRNDTTVSINDGQLKRNCNELYSVEVLLDSFDDNLQHPLPEKVFGELRSLECTKLPSDYPEREIN